MTKRPRRQADKPLVVQRWECVLCGHVVRLLEPPDPNGLGCDREVKRDGELRRCSGALVREDLRDYLDKVRERQRKGDGST